MVLVRWTRICDALGRDLLACPGSLFFGLWLQGRILARETADSFRFLTIASCIKAHLFYSQQQHN